MQTRHDPEVSAWIQQVNDAFSKKDIIGLAGALQTGRQRGWHSSLNWREAIRVSSNDREPEFLALFLTAWPTPVYYDEDGRSFALWAALNAHERTVNWGESNMKTVRKMAQWIPLDAVLARPKAASFSSGDHRERSTTRDAAEGRLRLIHFAAREGNDDLIRFLIGLGADPDGGVSPRGAASKGVQGLGAGKEDFAPLPRATSLVEACRMGNLAAAKALARNGALIDPRESARVPKDSRAGARIAEQALSTKIARREATQWGHFALETLADQSQAFPAATVQTNCDGPRVALAIAHAARQALENAALAGCGPAPDFSRLNGSGRAKGGRSPLARAARWAIAPLRSDDAFFRALWLRDAELMKEWAVAAKKRAGEKSARVAGLPPAAWIAAVAIAQEARARGRLEEIEALRSRDQAPQTAREGAAIEDRERFFGEEPGRRGSGGVGALFAPLAQGLGVEALDAPIGVWGGLSAVSAAALGDAPGALAALFDAGASADPSGKNGESALEWAALGLSRRCSALAARRSTARQGMGAALEWAWAKEPEAARECFRLAADAQEELERRTGVLIDPETPEQQASMRSRDSLAESLEAQAKSYADSEPGQREAWLALSAEYQRWRLRQSARGPASGAASVDRAGENGAQKGAGESEAARARARRL